MGYERYRTNGYLIRKKDMEDMIDLYEHGDTLQSIAEYMDFSYDIVKEIIKRETGYYTDKHPIHSRSYEKINKERAEKRNELVKEQKKQIPELYKAGKTVDEIVDIVKSFTISEIRKILHDNKLISDEEYDRHISLVDEDKDLRKLKTAVEIRKDLKIGDKFVIKTSLVTQRTITIEKIYPNVVMTDKGCFRINDLAIGKKIK